MAEQKIDYNKVKEPIDIMTSVSTSFQNTISNLERIIGKPPNSAWEGVASTSYQNKVKSLFNNLPEANKQLANSALFLASCVDNYLLLDQENIKNLKAIIGETDNDSTKKATDNQQNNITSDDNKNNNNKTNSSNDNSNHEKKSNSNSDSHRSSHHHKNNNSKSSSSSPAKSISPNKSKTETKTDNDNTQTTKKEETKTTENNPSYVLSSSEKEVRQKVVTTALKELNGHSSSYHTNGKKYLAFFGKHSGLWCSEFTSWVLNAAGVPQDVVKKFSGGTTSVHLRTRNIKDSNVYAFGIPDYSKMVDKSKSSVNTQA